MILSSWLRHVWTGRREENPSSLFICISPAVCKCGRFPFGVAAFFFFFFSNSTSVLWREVPSSSPLSAWRMEHHKPPGATKEQIQCPETDPKLTELRCYCARPRYKRSTNTSPRHTHGHTLTLLPLRVGEREKGLTFIDWAFRRRQRQIDWIILINI